MKERVMNDAVHHRDAESTERAQRFEIQASVVKIKVLYTQPLMSHYRKECVAARIPTRTPKATIRSPVWCVCPGGCR
jgi:hypothetical protein